VSMTHVVTTENGETGIGPLPVTSLRTVLTSLVPGRKMLPPTPTRELVVSLLAVPIWCQP
jgi:hypothetical protein